jgi:hypothetical protein
MLLNDDSEEPQYFTCDVCGRVFTTDDRLRLTVVFPKDSGVEPYSYIVCSECHYEFTKLMFDFIDHRRVETDGGRDGSKADTQRGTSDHADEGIQSDGKDGKG